MDTKTVRVELRNQDVAIAAAGVAIAIAAYFGALSELVGRWSSQEEYGHGFLIPLISFWLLWTRRDAIAASVGSPSWWGPAIISIAAAVHLVGELSAIFILSQLSLIAALFGVALSIGGRPLVRVTAMPIGLLVFSIPLPYFIEAMVTWRLQIVSSQLGAAIIQWFGVPVFLEGNIIDLGNYKLQVVEACSGLRYLYPLLCLSFLAAYLYAGSFTQRVIVFLSAVPITIFMNSLRIAVAGLLVNQWGTQMAEGAIHFFEGWVVFLACAGLLFIEIALLARLSGHNFWAVFGAPAMEASAPRVRSGGPAPALVGVFLLAATGASVLLVAERAEILPTRQRFAAFPTAMEGWDGRTTLLDPAVERALGMEDYLLADFRQSNVAPVNLYVAYYATQRKGVSPHSPLVCMPGGGWQIVEFERVAVSGSPINRAIVERGGHRQLVYYWFVQRGRKVANEFWSKWYLFADAIFMNRTDGALVRVSTPIDPREAVRAPDDRLHAFVAAVEPHLAGYLPSSDQCDASRCLKPSEKKVISNAYPSRFYFGVAGRDNGARRLQLTRAKSAGAL